MMCQTQTINILFDDQYSENFKLKREVQILTLNETKA